jgi:dTDP-glucose 4,6-dehydratase
MRILVTGADGFIGSHLVDLLLHWEKTDQVVAMVHSPPVKWVPHERGDKLRVAKADVKRSITLQKIGPVDVIFHLAAITSMGRCERHPETARLTNFHGTVNLLNMALGMDPMPVFVHMSTAALYGEAEYLPIDEQHPVEPNNQYTYSKLSAEITVAAYNQNQGMPTVIIRPFNVYGPRQDEEYVIPTIIKQCLMGYELRLGDGRPVRNFTYVTDAVDLLVRASVNRRAIGRVINLGSRQTHTIAEVAHKAVDLIGCDLEPVYDPAKYRPGEASIQEMDPTLAESLLGWSPRVWIDEGLKLTAQHFRAEVEADKQKVAAEMYGRY